jgi:hypothetical protein
MSSVVYAEGDRTKMERRITRKMDLHIMPWIIIGESTPVP